MLTDYGVSGICVFNLSGEVSKALNVSQKVSIKINFIPLYFTPASHRQGFYF